MLWEGPRKLAKISELVIDVTYQHLILSRQPRTSRMGTAGSGRFQGVGGTRESDMAYAPTKTERVMLADGTRCVMTPIHDQHGTTVGYQRVNNTMSWGPDGRNKRGERDIVGPDPGNAYRLLKQGERLGAWDMLKPPNSAEWEPVSDREVGVQWRTGMSPVRTLLPQPAHRICRNENAQAGDTAVDEFGDLVSAVPGKPYAILFRPIPESLPDPGEGYRLLEKGETVQAGDEMAVRENLLRDYGWSTVPSAGYIVPVESAFVFRRKPPPAPPPYYRLRNPEEVVEEGDEYWGYSEWTPLPFVWRGHKAGDFSSPIRTTRPLECF